MRFTKKQKLTGVLHTVIASFLLLMPIFVWGADFVPLTDLPSSFTTGNDPGAFFNSLFRYGIVIAGFLAVGMIVYGGFTYMTTDAVSGKGEAKDIISSAVIGLFLILLSFILLSLINPDILNFSLFKTN